MSTPTIVHRDQSTQTTPPPETTPAPETLQSPAITPAEKRDVASQSPALSLDLGHQSTDDRKTSADQTAGPAGPGIEPPLLEIPLLGPVPEGFGRAYGYLGKVKELADKIRPDLYETYFEQRFAQGSSRFAFCGASNGYGYHAAWDVASPDIYEHVGILRDNFHSTREQGHTALLVEAINKAGVQAIGMALDMTPCFFAYHFSITDQNCL
jgi:hypothetical protein